MLLLRILIVVGVVGAVLFAVAGRWDLPFFWAILLLFAGYGVGVVLLVDPETAQARKNPASAGPDRAFRLLLGLFTVVHLLLAALDVGRLHWTDEIPTWLRAVGVVGYALSLAFALWAMRENRFFVPEVRIQEERGHRVVRSGPYALVRHPGYVGSAAGAVSGGLALGSWLAFVPLLGAIGVLVARTAFEDRFLRSNLEGYGDYAESVRYRLLPGVW